MYMCRHAFNRERYGTKIETSSEKSAAYLFYDVLTSGAVPIQDSLIFQWKPSVLVHARESEVICQISMGLEIPRHRDYGKFILVFFNL